MCLEEAASIKMLNLPSHELSRTSGELKFLTVANHFWCLPLKQGGSPIFSSCSTSLATSSLQVYL